MPLSSVHLIPSALNLSVLGTENGSIKSCRIFKYGQVHEQQSVIISYDDILIE